MGYIIVWRDTHRDPHVDVNSRGFKEEYHSFDAAKEAADEIVKNENQVEKSAWYFDYQIYESCSS